MENSTFGYENYFDSSLREKLKNYLIERKKKNPSYSLRALAKKWDINHTSLSQFLNGKRKLSPAIFQKIVSNLDLEEEEKQILKKTEQLNINNYRSINEVESSVISDWIFCAILELVKVEGFQYNTLWMAQKLGVDEAKVSSAMTQLKSVGWIKEDPNKNTIQVIEENTSTIGKQEYASLILQCLGTQADKQKDSILLGNYTECSHTGITFAINPDDLPLARQTIYEFLHKMSALLERSGTPKKEVYRLNVSLFPLTQSDKSIS